jgi:hypothetical protein
LSACFLLGENMRAITLDELEVVSGGSLLTFVAEFVAGKLVDATLGAIADYNNSGQAAQDQISAAAGTFG